MRSISRWLPVLSVACAVNLPAYGADYPSKPIRFLIPFPPGGAVDTFARITAQRLNEKWKAQTVIEPRPGAGGIIATELASKANADGYTFLIVTVGHAVNPSIYSKLPYDTLRDFTGVGMVAMSPNVLVVHPSVPAKSAQELIAIARGAPGKLNYGTGGNATTAHVAAEMLSTTVGIKMTHVPFKGAPLAVQDLVAGRLDLMLDQVVSSIGFIRAGRLRPLAVTPAKRTPQLPEIPTLAESGVPGYDFTAWFLFVAPAKTPPAAIEKLNAELRSASVDTAFHKQLAKFGADPAPPKAPAEVDAFIGGEIARWAKVTKAANIRVQ